MLTFKNRTPGFTIVEVLIVLAIAGVLLLIVFLAVPSLQRTSRNSQRRHDAGLLTSAIAECVNTRGDYKECEYPDNIPIKTSDFGISTGFVYARTATSNGKPLDCNEQSCPVAYTPHYATLTEMTYLFYSTCDNSGKAVGTSLGQNYVVIYKHENGSNTGDIVSDQGFNCLAG